MYGVNSRLFFDQCDAREHIKLQDDPLIFTSPDKMETWFAFFCFKQKTVAMESLWQQHLEYHASVPWWAAEETHIETHNINR